MLAATKQPPKPSPAPRRPAARPLRVVLYGVEGVGKSTFAADAPAPIFLCDEDATAHLDVQRFPTPRNLTDVLEALRVLTDDEHPFKTLVIDTVDWLEPIIWAHVCAIAGVSHLDDLSYGKGYIAAVETWKMLVGRLELLVRLRQMNVILLGGATIKRMDSPQGTVDRYLLKVHEKSADVLRDWADCVLFARFEKVAIERLMPRRGLSEVRVLHAAWSPRWDARTYFEVPASMPLSFDELDGAIKAFEPRDAGSIRSVIYELIPRLADQEKAITVMHEWAGDDPRKLFSLLDRIRSKIALEGGGEGLEARVQQATQAVQAPQQPLRRPA